jgi:hypothetical protein
VNAICSCTVAAFAVGWMPLPGVGLAAKWGRCVLAVLAISVGHDVAVSASSSKATIAAFGSSASSTSSKSESATPAEIPLFFKADIFMASSSLRSFSRSSTASMVAG